MDWYNRAEATSYAFYKSKLALGNRCIGQWITAAHIAISVQYNITETALSYMTLRLKFMKPTPTQVSMTVPVSGSALILNVTPKNSLRCLKNCAGRSTAQHSQKTATATVTARHCWRV
jgi:hypothetical protein